MLNFVKKLQLEFHCLYGFPVCVSSGREKEERKKRRHESSPVSLPSPRRPGTQASMRVILLAI